MLMMMMTMMLMMMMLMMMMMMMMMMMTMTMTMMMMMMMMMTMMTSLSYKSIKCKLECKREEKDMFAMVTLSNFYLLFIWRNLASPLSIMFTWDAGKRNH